MILDTIRKLIKNDSVPLVHVEGNDKVTKIQWVGDVQKSPNSLLDYFSLISWEIRSNSVEFFFRGKSLGWGFVGDIAGPTVDIKRNVKDLQDRPVPVESETPKGFSVFGVALRIPEIIPDRKKKLNTSPCVIIKGKNSIREIHFEYFEVLDDTLLDTRSKCRYAINPDTKIEITMPDGTTGTGWVCDPSGQTITISRNVVVMALVRDKHGNPLLKDGKPIEVEVGINWSGRLGKYLTNDKGTALWSTAASGKEKLIFGILAFVIGNLIGVVMHI